jgi:epoxyqueuosine reductase
VLRVRLRSLVAWMAETAAPGFEAFSCVDNGPVQERVFAEQAGLGWIGKNTCVINSKLGSWLFLADVLTNADLEPDAPALDQCGTCTRCLDACPTQALFEPYSLDATRCLSYLTIESRGSVDRDLRPAIARQVYGCDICQEVCPWNRRAAVSDDPAWQPRDGLMFPRLLDLCRLSDEGWRARLKGSAMRRAGLSRIRRSLAYAAAALPPDDRVAALTALASHPSATDRFVGEAIGALKSL